jgi:hypothetical protein
MQNALTPDDWLISPQVELNGVLRMWLRGQDPGYAAEHFAVYVSTAGNTDVADFTTELIGETVAEGHYVEYTADLSAFEGQMGYIAIRHFNCTDQFRLNLDNFLIQDPEAVIEDGEWITAEGVTNPYALEGLTPETEYEVQVQGNYEDRGTTEWTESVFFTTLEAPVVTEYNEFYVVGNFNGWNQEEGNGRVELVANEEGTEFTGTLDLAAGDKFKVITPNPTGGWIWFGGVDENNVGYFLVNEGLLDVNISLIDGSNFMIEEAGNYTITVKQAPATDGKGVQEPLVMVVSKTTVVEPLTIEGYVIDNESNPIEGVTVTLTVNTPEVDGLREATTSTTTTDAEGYYAFEVMPVEGATYSLTFSKDGYVTKTVEVVPGEDQEIVLEDDSVQGIDGIYSDMKNDNAWYGVNGVRYERKPVAPGIYIHNGKKVVIK